MGMPVEDRVVLLDEWGLPAGTADRRTVHDDRTPLHLAFSCYVFDRADRLLITRRAAGKTFAGVWTNSFCGHPRPGEALDDAIARRGREELGLELADIRLVLPDFRYRAELDGIVENEMCPVVTARAVSAPAPDPTEVDAFAWVEWEAFSEEVCAGTRSVSVWSEEQIGRLRALGPRASWWPASPERLPPAALWSPGAQPERDRGGPAVAPHRSGPERLPDLAAVEGVGPRVDAQIRALVEREITAFDSIDPTAGAFARDAASAAWGGKRLRAVTAYWGWRGAGGDPNDEIVAAAAALELLHAFALTHDDVMDESDVRRGRPSMHRRFAVLHRTAGWTGSADAFGNAAAILGGDLCLSWADAMLARSGMTDEALRRGRPVYDAMRSELVAGQYLDLVQQARGTHNVADALTVARFKTAGYTIERPLHFGAALAGADVELVGAYRRYGQALGQAFQLRDDLIGAFGDPSVTGKQAGDDIRSGKSTTLVACALEKADDAARQVILSALGDATLDEVCLERVRDTLVEVGAVSRIESMIADLAGEASEAIANAPVTESARPVLQRLVTAATQREL